MSENLDAIKTMINSINNFIDGRASIYFRIGENKLRKMIDDNVDAKYILWNGNRPQIKRHIFEDYIDKCNTI